MSKTLTARLYAIFYESIMESSSGTYTLYLHDKWASALKSLYVEKYGGFADLFTNEVDQCVSLLKELFKENNYLVVLGTTEWLVRRLQDTPIPEAVEAVLRAERAAYRLVDRQDIVVLASEEEGEALQQALSVLDRDDFRGARKHLKSAATHLASGRYADSVRESVHSIESAARVISKTSKFSDALTEIEKRGNLHSAFKRGLVALYGYSSDEQGIRHPLLENGDASVKEEDALLMLGICSAAITYLLSHKDR